MRILLLLVCAICMSGAVLSPGAHADRKVKKTINISREAIDRAYGNEVIAGDITKVGHEVIYIETDDGRMKIDLDDISFPARIDEIFREGDRVVATGLLDEDELTANRIVLIRDDIRRTFISKKPVDIKIKGEEDLTIRITP